MVKNTETKYLLEDMRHTGTKTCVLVSSRGSILQVGSRVSSSDFGPHFTHLLAVFDFECVFLFFWASEKGNNNDFLGFFEDQIK